MFRLAATIGAVGLLAACGGGDGTSATLPKVTTLAVFGDSAGVARVQNDQLTMTVMAPDNQSFKPTNDEVAVDTSGLRFVNSNAYGDFYAGTVTINGTPVKTSVYEDDSGQSFILFAYNSQASVLAAFGPNVSNIPAGTHIYNGTNVIGERSTSAGETGTFSMTVNFDAGTAAISGSTSNSTIGGSGIAVNNTTGTFQGSNMNLVVNGYNDGKSVSSSIYGSFHGNGAVGVSGIYHDNSSTPVFAGAIAGSR